MVAITGSGANVAHRGARGQGLWARLVSEWNARRVYARTLRELRSMSARERADLGIELNIMSRIAAEAAWGGKKF